MDVTPPKTRIGILHALRGIAALLVVYGHMFSVGLNDSASTNYYVPAITGTAISESQRPLGTSYLSLELLLASLGTNSGHLGVMLFFLISGFVISISINKTNQATFIARRAARIYPTCIAAVIATAIFVKLYCNYYGIEYPFSLGNVISSATLVSGWLGQGAVIPVLWTLSVEIAFYLLLSAVAASTKSKLGIKELNIASLACIAFVAIGAMPLDRLSGWPITVAALKWTSFVAANVAFMLIGSAVFLLYSRSVSVIKGSVGLLTTIALYGISIFIFSTQREPIGATFLGGLAILALFVAILVLGRNINPKGILKFYGDISYPLYLCHIPLAWIILYETTRHGISLHIGAALSIAVITFVSWILHIAIERPSQEWSKKLRISIPSKATAAAIQ